MGGGVAEGTGARRGAKGRMGERLTKKARQ